MIAIVCDSTVSLTKKEATDIGASIVPMVYTVEGRVFHESFLDHSGNFERTVLNYKCTTSQPSPAAFMSTFEELKRKGYEILCLVISSRLSGSYSSALLAAKEVGGDSIRVVDTRTAGDGQKLLCECAAEFIAKGLSLENVALRLEEEREKVAIAFSVENMDPLRRSGRLGFVRQSISTILNVRPILKCEDGAILAYDFSKGRQQQIAKLVNAIPKGAKKICISSLGADVAAERLRNAVKAEFPDITVRVSKAGPVIAIHVGIPALSVAWIE